METSPGATVQKLAGPSEAEWRQHRDVISNLYPRMPLRQVQKIMKDQFQFDANKRMYDRKLHQWGVTKNIKRDKKEELAGLIVAAALRGQTITDCDISENTYKKVLRHTRAMKGQRQSSKNLGSRREKKSILPARDSVSERPVARNLKLSNKSYVIADNDQPSSSTSSSPNNTFITTPETDYDDIQSRTGSLFSSSESTTPSPWHRQVTSPNDIWEIVDKHDLFASTIPSPPLLLPTSRTSLNLQNLFGSMRNYCQGQLSLIATSSETGNAYSMRIALSKDSKTFWCDIKHGIYLLKVDSPHRAWPFLNRACESATTVITQHNIRFIIELFSALSPVNTRKNPEVRRLLLQYLSCMARQKLTASHPIALLCHELQHDDQSREVSEQSIYCMLEQVTTVLGRLHPISFKMQRSVISLLRRDGDLASAESLAMKLITDSHRAFGQTSLQYRTAVQELVHVLISLEEYQQAREWALKVVCADQSSSAPASPYFQDERAIYGMEDMAEISEKLGDLNGATKWLARAVELSHSLFGRSLATLPILDKLCVTLASCGKVEDAMYWSSKYSE